MKLLIVSTPAILTPPEAYGGMERMVNWLVEGLIERGHEVSCLAKTGSTVPNVIEGESEDEFVQALGPVDNFDVIIDFSHDKTIARTFPDKPQINTYQVMSVREDHPLNPVFISKGQREHHRNHQAAPVIYYGLDFEDYPLHTGPREDYLLYLGSLIGEKRPHWAAEIGQQVGLPVKISGPRWQPEYWPVLEEMEDMDGVEVLEEVGGQEKIELIQKARCLIHPVGDRNWVEAGAIIVLEALALGTPVICTPNGCLPEYIRTNINGFMAENVEGMVGLVPLLHQINPSVCRASIGYYSYDRMASDYEILAEKVLAGARW